MFKRKWNNEGNEVKAKALAKFLINCHDRCPERNLNVYLPINYTDFNPSYFSLSLLNQSGIDAAFSEFWKNQNYYGKRMLVRELKEGLYFGDRITEREKTEQRIIKYLREIDELGKLPDCECIEKVPRLVRDKKKTFQEISSKNPIKLSDLLEKEKSFFSMDYGEIPLDTVNNLDLSTRFSHVCNLEQNSIKYEGNLYFDKSSMYLGDIKLILNKEPIFLKSSFDSSYTSGILEPGKIS